MRAICDADVAAKAQKKPKAKLAPEVVADVVADDCAGNRGGNDRRYAFAPVPRMQKRP